MPFSQKDILLGLVVPALASMIVVAVVAWLSRKRDSTGTAAAPAVVLGFLLGYWLLKLGPVVPEFDRDWLPYTAVCALVPAMIPRQSRHSFKLQLLALAIVVIVSAWVLVPTWDSLEPSRTVHLAVWTIYTFALSAGLLSIARAGDWPQRSSNDEEPLRQVKDASRSGGLLFLFLMLATLSAASALLLLSESLLFCQIMLAGTAAFAGLALVYATASRFFQFRPSLSGAALVYSILVSAAMLTGKVNSFSDVPTSSYLILPLTPLAYGLALPARSGELSWKQTLLVIVVALAICGLAMGLALSAEFGGESEY